MLGDVGLGVGAGLVDGGHDGAGLGIGGNAGMNRQRVELKISLMGVGRHRILSEMGACPPGRHVRLSGLNEKENRRVLSLRRA